MTFLQSLCIVEYEREKETEHMRDVIIFYLEILFCHGDNPLGCTCISLISTAVHLLHSFTVVHTWCMPLYFL